MQYTKKQKENIRKVFIKEMKIWDEVSKKGLFKSLKFNIEKE